MSTIDPASYVIQGNAFYTQNKMNDAIKNYTKAIELNPKYADAYCNRGLAFKAQNKLENAFKDYTKAIELNPNHTNAYFNRGLAFSAQNKLEDAIKDYTKAIEFNPKLADAYCNRGLAFFAQNKLDDAIKDYTKAIELNPNHTNAYSNRGLAFYNQNKLEDAIKDYTYDIELNPNNHNTYLSRGVAFKAQNKLEDAIKDYTKAIELNPNLADAYCNRGFVYYAQNKLEDAFKDYTKAIELDQNHHNTYLNRGIAFYAQNKLEDAIKNYTKAIELNPNYADAYWLAFYAQNKLEDTLKDFTKAIELDPNHPIHLSNIGKFYLQQMQLELSHKYIKQAQDIIDKTDQQQLIIKYNINSDNYNYIKQTIQLLQKIKTNFEQNQVTSLQLRKQNKITEEEEKQYLEKDKNILESLKKESPDQKTQVENLERIFQQQNQIISELQERLHRQEQKADKLEQKLDKQEYRLDKQDQKLDNQEERLISIEQTDSFIIDQKLKLLKQPENKNKKLYYLSFCPRILSYLEACVLIQTGYFQVNNNVVINTKSEKMIEKLNQVSQIAAPILGNVPIIGSALEKLLQLLNYGFEKYKENKFNQQISKIMAVVKCKSGTQSEREKEFQLATFENSEMITEQDLDIKKLEYYEEVQEIISIEYKQQILDAYDEYWQLGVYHCIIVLKYIENESSQLTANNNIDLRNIISQGLKMRQIKKQKVDNVEKSGCTCEIF